MSYKESAYRGGRTTSGKDEKPVDISRCYATNCPCRATLSVEGGKWMCTAHAFAPSDRWPAITEKLRENSWLVEFIDEIKLMRRALTDWRGFSVQFWANSDEVCQPDPKEEYEPYENRMRGELLFRCGIAKRPAVRIPKHTGNRFKQRISA